MAGLQGSIRVTGDLDQDRFDRLLRAAEHWSVSNSLEGSSPVEIFIELVYEV